MTSLCPDCRRRDCRAPRPDRWWPHGFRYWVLTLALVTFTVCFWLTLGVGR